MNTVIFAGISVPLLGRLPEVGEEASTFVLTSKDLQEVSLEIYGAKRKVLSIVPSLDTPVCAKSTRIFNEKAASFPNTIVLVISADLPFAMSRFCTTESIQNIQTLSTFRHKEFQQNYGVEIAEGALKGVMARAIIVLNEKNQVIYVELVKEVKDEPNYNAVIKVLGGTLDEGEDN